MFYTALLTKDLRPEMARLTLARKIATIVLIVWKRGASFDAQHLEPQALGPLHLWGILSRWPWGSRDILGLQYRQAFQIPLHGHC